MLSEVTPGLTCIKVSYQGALTWQLMMHMKPELEDKAQPTEKCNDCSWKILETIRSVLM